MISFNNIPANIRVPGYYAEFDSSNAVASVSSTSLRILVIGQALEGPLLDPQQMFHAGSGLIFGDGSMLSEGVAAVKGANNQTECWAIGVADPEGGVAATGTLSFGGGATASGTIALYIGGLRITMVAAQGDDAAALAVKAAAAINTPLNSMVTAVSDGDDVTVTAKHSGVFGNDIPIMHSIEDDEMLPAGMTLGITAMAGGAGEIDLETIWAAIGDEQYNIILLPSASSAALNSAGEEVLRRADPSQAIDALACAGLSANVTAAIAAGNAVNNQFITLLPAYESPEHPYILACAYYAVCAAAAEIDPSRPFQTLRVPSVYTPSRSARWTRTEREALLRAGMSTFTVDAAGSLTVERPITTYKTNPSGAEDPAWLDINVPLSLANIRRTFRIAYALSYPRHKLADDGVIFGQGQAVVTPNVLRAKNAAIYIDLARAGQVDDTEGFIADQIVERNVSDRNRVDQVLPVRLIGQYRVQATKIQYQL